MKTKVLAILLVLGMLFGIAGCNKEFGELETVYEDDGEPYEIVYYLIYNAANPPQDVSEVQNALNKVLKEKINATVQIHAYTLAEYTSRVSGAIAAGVKFDVCFTSPEINPYITNVQREAFIPLDDLLPTYAPQTWAAFPEEMWDQARVNGHIYGSINEQILPRTFGLNFESEDHLELFLNTFYPGTTPATVIDALEDKGKTAYEFVTEYLTWMRDNDYGAGGRIANLDTESTLQNLYGFDNLGTGCTTPGVVQIDDETYTVINQFESDEYIEMIDQVYQWQEDGFIQSTGSAYDITADSTWKPGYLPDNLVKLSQSHYFTSYIIGSMNAISTTSENPARAMKFIELMRTDEDVHNILQFGVEDIHYIKDPANDQRIAQFIESSGSDNRQLGWGLGT